MGKKPYRRLIVLPSAIFYFLGLLTLFFPFAARAADKPLEKVRIAYSSISSNTVPIWVAYDQGFFRKYGLDVQLLFIEGGSWVIQTLISGDVAAAQVGGSAVLEANIQGAGVKIVAGFINTMPYKFMVAKDITNPEQLKGKTVAVSRFGSSSDFATRYAIDKYGLVVGKDVAVMQKYMRTDDIAGLEEGYDSIAVALVPEKPYPTVKGIQIMLQEMAIKEPKAQAAKPEQFVDLTFMRELDKSGFIDRLYKAAPAVATRMESPIVSAKDKEKPVVAEKASPSPASQPKISPTPV